MEVEVDTLAGGFCSCGAFPNVNPPGAKAAAFGFSEEGPKGLALSGSSPAPSGAASASDMRGLAGRGALGSG